MSNTDDEFKRREEYLDVPARVEALEIAMRENTRLTNETRRKVDSIDTGVQELLLAFEAAKGAWKVLEFVGKGAKLVTWIGVLGGAFLWVWQHITSHFKQ